MYLYERKEYTRTREVIQEVCRYKENLTNLGFMGNRMA